MSLLSKLAPSKGTKKKMKRLGRGDASGHGGTSTRGHKGQLARSSPHITRGFEGGQMPLHRRSPKWGFTNPSKVLFNIVNLDAIEKSFNDGDTVSYDSCLSKGLVRFRGAPLKVLGRGSLTKKLSFQVDSLSASAKKQIESKKGTILEVK